MIRTLLALLPPGSSRRVSAHLLLTLLSVVVRAVTAVLLVPLLAALFSTAPGEAWPWAAAIAVLTVAGWVLDRAVVGIGFSLGFTTLEHAQHDLAERLARTRLTWFTARHRAEARQAIGAVGPDLVGILIYLVTPVLSAVLLPLATALALLPIAWQLALAALACVPLMLGAQALSRKLGRHSDRAASAANSELTERIVEFARTQHALRAARRVAPERSQVGAALEAQHGASLRLLALQVPGQLLFGIAAQAALVLLTAVAIALHLRGELSAPEGVALVVVAVRLLEPFTVLAELSGGVGAATDLLRRIRTVLTSPTDPDGDVALAPAAPPRLTLRGIRFAYGADDDDPGAARTERPVLEGLDLELEPGTTTAIVGPSGSGKSTVLSLLAGLHQPTSGQVLVDGVDAATLDAAARQRLTSVVFQHPFLSDGSLEENVRAGDPGASPQQLGEVARLARVDGVLEQLGGDWGAAVGEGGGLLSGGERQRVSIARALLKPSPVLLVDEATSALDTENEAAIVAALAEDTRPRTRVIVTHRLPSLRTADRVVFLEDGRIVEDGGVEELLAAGGRFAEFWRGQDDAARWRLGADAV